MLVYRHSVGEHNKSKQCMNAVSLVALCSDLVTDPPLNFVTNSRNDWLPYSSWQLWDVQHGTSTHSSCCPQLYPGTPLFHDGIPASSGHSSTSSMSLCSSWGASAWASPIRGTSSVHRPGWLHHGAVTTIPAMGPAVLIAKLADKKTINQRLFIIVWNISVCCKF